MKENFKLGQVVVTKAIHEMMQENLQFRMDVYTALERYRNGDWGDTCPEDAAKNDEAVKNGNDRIFAVYEICDRRIWIITEWNQQYTTVLFPEDY